MTKHLTMQANVYPGTHDGVSKATLFVCYTAKAATGALANGWMTIGNCGQPQSTADVEALCKRIADAEGLTGVIPLWWKELNL